MTMTRALKLIRAGAPTIELPNIVDRIIDVVDDDETPERDEREGEREYPYYQPPDIEMNVRMYSGEDIEQYGHDLYNALRRDGWSKQQAAEVADTAVKLHGVTVEDEEVTYAR